MQIPAGAALDTWGPRRVSAVLLMLSALGLVIFGVSTGLGGLMVGRVLIGAGVAVSLGAALQALAQHFPPSRRPLVNGMLVALGALGGAAVGTPLAWLLEYMDWRQASLLMAVVTTLAALLIGLGVPDAPTHLQSKRIPMRAQFQGTWTLLCSGAFWKLTLFPSVTAGVFYAVQSLWIKPFVMDVDGATSVAADALVSWLGIAVAAGGMASGVMSRWVERFGMNLHRFAGLCLGVFMLAQLCLLLGLPIPRPLIWALYGLFGTCAILVYAILLERYPSSMWGRVNTTYTMQGFFLIFIFQSAIGWIIELWEPVRPGVYPAQAHLAAWWFFLAVQAVAAVWYFWPERPGQAR